MAGKYFNFTDVIGYGWRVMKANLWFFVGLILVWLIIAYLPIIIKIILIRLFPPGPIHVVLRILIYIISFIIGIIIGIGWIKIALSFCDERKPTIGMLFDARDCFWRYVGATILFYVIMLCIFVPCGLVAKLLTSMRFHCTSLIILVGIVLAVRFGIQFSLCYYFVIDKGLGPVQALKASSRTTMGVKWQLLGFFILCGLINLLGVLCLLVGVFATYPTVLLATALVYRQLIAQTPELAEFGITTVSAEPSSEPLPDEQEF